MAALLNPSGPPPSAARLDLEQDVLALQARLIHTGARVQQLLYERARLLPISGRMPVIMLTHCCYDCPGGKWIVLVKLKDFWEVLDRLLSSSGFSLGDIRYQQRQLQQEQEVLPDEVVQQLLKRVDELRDSCDAPSRLVVHNLSVFARGEAASLEPTGVKWREQVPDFLDTALDLCGQLQAYAAELSALVPCSYVCNNLKCVGLDLDSEAAAAAKVCTRCRTARYCWVDCQAANWKDLHKAACNCLKAARAAAPAAQAAA